MKSRDFHLMSWDFSRWNNNSSSPSLFNELITLIPDSHIKTTEARKSKNPELSGSSAFASSTDLCLECKNVVDRFRFSSYIFPPSSPLCTNWNQKHLALACDFVLHTRSPHLGQYQQLQKFWQLLQRDLFPSLFQIQGIFTDLNSVN